MYDTIVLAKIFYKISIYMFFRRFSTEKSPYLAFALFRRTAAEQLMPFADNNAFYTIITENNGAEKQNIYIIIYIIMKKQ